MMYTAINADILMASPAIVIAPRDLARPRSQEGAEYHALDDGASAVTGGQVGSP